MVDVLRDYATGANDGSTLNVIVPTLLTLYREEGNITTFWQTQATLNLENEKIHMYETSTIKIQNRSLDASGSTSTETVSNNPLVGKMYHFTSGCPRARVPGVQLLEAMYNSIGVLSCRGAELTAIADGFREPPNPKFFWNCNKTSGIKLDPGSVKQDSISHKRSGFLLKVLKGLFLGSGPTATGSKTVSLAGKSALIALEDLINVSSTANITIAYEVNRRFGAYLTTHKQTSATGTVYQATYNNIAP